MNLMSLQHDCFQCGNKLIEVKNKMEGNVKVTIFKCSNKTCQKEIDSKVSEARQKIREHLEAKRLRMVEKEEQRLKLLA